MFVNEIILKLVRNWRIFITCCIRHTDLAFYEKIIFFKTGGICAVNRTFFRVILVNRFDSWVPRGKTIIIAHE
jgi:hypothetical protein